MPSIQTNIQDKAKEAMHRAQEAINTVQEAFEGDTATNLKGKAYQAKDLAKDTWADAKVALGMEKPRWTSQHPYLLNTFIALAALLFVIGAGYALAKFARSRQAQKKLRELGRAVMRPSTAGQVDAGEEEDEASVARRRRVGGGKQQ